LEPRSVMIYASSGGTKTTQLYFLAKYIYETTGKKIKMVHSSLGGYTPFVDSGMIARGEVEVFEFKNRVTWLADYRRLSMGYWPRRKTDGTEFFETHEACKISDAEWAQTGGYFFDDLTSVCEALKSHCSNQEGNLGLKESFVHEEGGFTFRGINDFRLYNIVQEKVLERLGAFTNFPVDYVVFSALVGKGEDKQSRETVYGPQLVGNAATYRLPSMFNAGCFHLSKEKYKDKSGSDVEGRVAWFVEHNDGTTGVPYLCNSRLTPELVPELLKYFPYGFVPLGYTKGLDMFFRVVDKLKRDYVSKGKVE